MSRCVEKPFAPLLAVWSYQSVRPVPHRAVTARGERVFCYGRAEFLSEQTECRSLVTEMPLPRYRKSVQPVP